MAFACGRVLVLFVQLARQPRDSSVAAWGSRGSESILNLSDVARRARVMLPKAKAAGFLVSYFPLATAFCTSKNSVAVWLIGPIQLQSIAFQPPTAHGDARCVSLISRTPGAIICSIAPLPPHDYA